MDSRTKGEAPQMNCLRCSDQELKEISFAELDGATIHMCPQCEGAFYPRLALQTVARSDREDVEQSELAPVLEGDKLEGVDLEKPVFCPVCEEEMGRFSYSLAPEVQLDECPEHGMWLDDGELGVMLDEIASREMNMAEYRQKIKDKREEMEIDAIARGGKYNPFALTLRVLNKVFTLGKG